MTISSQPPASAPLSFAEHVAVVDLPELDRPAPGRHPRPDDAALAADVVRRPRQKAQECVPRRGAHLADQRHLANQMPVEHFGELLHGAVAATRGLIVQQQSIGQHRHAYRTAFEQPPRALADPRERRLNGRMRRGIQCKDPRRRLARPRKVGQPRRLLWGEGCSGRPRHRGTTIYCAAQSLAGLGRTRPRRTRFARGTRRLRRLVGARPCGRALKPLEIARLNGSLLTSERERASPRRRRQAPTPTRRRSRRASR